MICSEIEVSQELTPSTAPPASTQPPVETAPAALPEEVAPLPAAPSVVGADTAPSEPDTAVPEN